MCEHYACFTHPIKLVFNSLPFIFNIEVFDVMLNRQHSVVEHLDIFAKVGRAVAHEEIIPFRVEDGQLFVNGETSAFDGTLVIEFVKVGKMVAVCI